MSQSPEISPTPAATSRRVQRTKDKQSAASARANISRAMRNFKAAVFFPKTRPYDATPAVIAEATTANEIREQQIVSMATALANYFRGGENQNLVSFLETARAFARANNLSTKVIDILNLEAAN